MATRFYLSNVDLTGEIGTDWDEGWYTLSRDSNSWKMNYTKGTSVMRSSKNGLSRVQVPDGEYSLARQYISSPLATQTISLDGTYMRGQLMTREFADTDQLMEIVFILRLIRDGQNITSLAQYDYVGTEFINNATFQNRIIANTVFDSGEYLDVVEGDRLILEIGFVDDGSSPPPDVFADAMWGEDAPDLPYFDEATTTLGAGWFELEVDLEFQKLETTGVSTGRATVACTSVSLGNSASQIKYNVYYATSAVGPWTLHNLTPLDNNPNGNSYTLEGLTSGVLYYIMVVAGSRSGSTFSPLSGQPIVPTSEPGTGVSNPNIVSTRTFIWKKNATDEQAFQFELMNYWEGL